MSGKISKEDTYAVFHTEKTFKAYAKSIGVSPNTLRKWWVEKFGQEAFDERGTRLQRASAVKVGSAKKGTTYKLSTKSYSCEECSHLVDLSGLQVSRLKRILCESCLTKNRGIDRSCPVCDQKVAGVKGMAAHFVQQRNDIRHAKYQELKKQSEWDGKVEFQDFVVCKVCGFKDSTLGRHIGSAHNLTADQYRKNFPGAYLVSTSVTQKRSSSVKKAHIVTPKAGLKKTILCEMCDTSFEVSAFSSNEALCKECDEIEQESEWVGLTDPEDYVVCQKCGYKAENLSSHLQHAHPQLVGVYSKVYPGFLANALNSGVRDKSLLIGKPLSDDTKKLMSENAGRWNKGLTKETDERVAQAAEKMLGRPAWSKGLTKEEHQSLQGTSEKLKQYVGDNRPWTNGLEAELTFKDFAPYLEEDGVDRARMAEELDYCEETITKYMEHLGLPLSKKYIKARVEADKKSGRFSEMSKKSSEVTTVKLTSEQLDPYRSKKGDVWIGRAITGLGHVYSVVKRECDRLGIPTRKALISQERCLSVISKSLGGSLYESEWKSWRFVNPKTGHRFRFDGYFPSHNLIAEFHGHQHYEFPSVYVKTEKAFLDLQERDRIKENLIRQDPVLKYFLVREDEPFDDSEYLKGRLIQEGILALEF